MCIRDSVGTHVLWNVVHVKERAAFPVCRVDKPLLGKETVCLLYTSDAADERSSVDLGGRRIITKKKKNK